MRIAIILVPDFNALATVAFVDPLRVANYLAGERLFEWNHIGLDGDAVRASNQSLQLPEYTLEEASGPYELAMVCSSWAPEAHRTPALFGWLRRRAAMGMMLGGVDTGAFLLAYAGLMDGYRASVHYEHLEAFRELFPNVHVTDALFARDRDRLTCCGNMASADLALEIVRESAGLSLANETARYMFHERVRPGNESQAVDAREPVGGAAPKVVRDAVILMEANLEDPIPVEDVAEAVGLSQRQIERLFRRETGASPVRFYIDMRLDRARGMVTQTDMSILEISVACGFGSAEHFARAYKARFNLTPSEDRISGRVPFQFRPLPARSR